MINEPITTALNSSTFTAINIPKVHGFISVSYFMEDDTLTFYESATSAGPGALIPAGKVINIALMKVDIRTGTVLYAKSASGTPNLIIKWGLAQGQDGANYRA